MSVIRIFLDANAVKLLDCNDVINYTSYYQIAFDKLLNLLNTKSWISKKTIEITLQGSLLRHLEGITQLWSQQLRPTERRRLLI